jgi:hypothetical protein
MRANLSPPLRHPGKNLMKLKQSLQHGPNTDLIRRRWDRAAQLVQQQPWVRKSYAERPLFILRLPERVCGADDVPAKPTRPDKHLGAT